MKKISNKIKASEPIIQTIYFPSFVRIPICHLMSKKYSRYFEFCNALIFFIFYDLSVLTNRFHEGISLHKGENDEGKALH